MAEAYLFYSSLTLLAMGCSTLVLSMLFRLKSWAINSLPKNLSANVFNKTFFVFDPYPERRKIIHNFLSVLPILVFLACLGLILIVWKIFEYGLMLSLFISVICLNLIAVEVAPEAYQDSETFIKAVQCGTSLGVGDVQMFQIVRRALPKLSNYYLGLTILFVTSAITLSYLWSLASWFFAQFIGLIFEAGAVTGYAGWQVAVFLFALAVVIIQILVWKIKNKFLSYVTE